jgi:4-amino-4-deoxy-L-arabinose transferase-like glycosyltransferase
VLVFILVVSLVAAALILPGWLWARKRSLQSFWLFLLPASGVGFWALLAALRLGPQSLSNLIEIPIVAVVAVFTAYGKFIYLDKRMKRQDLSNAISFIVVAIVTLGLRLFMPLLPE